MFKDLSKKLGGDAFAYVQLINNNCSLWEACKIINNDFDLKFGKFIISLERPIIIQDYNHKVKEKRIINVVNQNFTVDDLEWWTMYGISESTLNKYNVLSVKELYINSKLKRVYTRKYPIYAYFFPRTKNYKIYIPNEDKWNKWDTNANNDWDIQGYDQLPEKGETIYITKSMKDVMVFKVMFDFLGTPVDCIAPHAESINLSEKFITAIKERYKRIIIVSDFDLAGVKFAQQCRKKHDIQDCKFISTTRHFIDGKMKVLDKDISDYRMLHNRQKTLKLLEQWNVA